MTLAFSSASTCDTFSSCPGLSGSGTAKQNTLPRAISALSMRADMVEMSMLPPDMMGTTFLLENGSLSRAASESTPAPSATSLCFSISERRALMISISETVMISSRYLLQKVYVRSPGVFTAQPSATVSTVWREDTCPFENDVFMQAAPAGSTPITLISGLTDFAANATPLANPPPPIGTRIASTSFSSLMISSAVVP